MKRLTEEKLDELLEAGVEEFARSGLSGANMRAIAERAGISVGVLYKYYEDKEDLFHACLDRSLEALNSVLREAAGNEASLKEYVRRLIRLLLRFSKEHSAYVRLYCTLAASSGESAARLADKIEGISAKIYTEYIASGQESGHLRQDMDSGMSAFFFDNLLMMIQFAGCCDYYRERFRLYCGGDLEEQEERLEREILKFLESAFKFNEADSVRGE